MMQLNLAILPVDILIESFEDRVTHRRARILEGFTPGLLADGSQVYIVLRIILYEVVRRDGPRSSV